MFSLSVEEKLISVKFHWCLVQENWNSTHFLPGTMGIFGSKNIVWVPENEKLKEKCVDADSWDAKER